MLTPKEARKAEEDAGRAFLAVPDFAEAWEDWLANRRLRKLSVSEQCQTGHFRVLGRMTVENAVASIYQSIDQGWQGLFEVKNGTAKASVGRIRSGETIKPRYAKVGASKEPGADHHAGSPTGNGSGE